MFYLRFETCDYTDYNIIMQLCLYTKWLLSRFEISVTLLCYQAQIWNQDHFGFPINARPFSAIGTVEKIEIAEVINQMVKRACLFESPKTIFEDTITPTAPTTTISTTTAYRKLKVETEADVEKMEAGRVLMQPVVAEPAYPNLVSN